MMALRNKRRAELYLVLAGIAVAASVCVAGWLHYRAAMRLRDSSQWVKHSYIVSASLELESQRIDRIEPAIKLYQLTRDDDQFRIAETNAVSLYSRALDLQDLVNDNPSQTRLARQLAAQASALATTINGLTAQSPLPSQQVLGCRETISLMQRAEAELLRQRTEQTDAEDRLGERVGISSTLFSLVVVLVLFGLLIRDLRQHHRYQKQLSDTNEQLGETVHALELRARETELMAEARNELQLCMNSQQAQASAARSLEKLLPATRGAICMINSSLQQVEIVASWNDPASLLDSFSLVSCCGLRSGHPRWRTPNKSEVHCEHFTAKEPERYLCLPVAAHGETLGMIYIECPSAGVAAMVESQAPLLSEMIEMASMAIASLNLRNRLEHQSVRDGLTGLFNRHFMEMALERELRRAHRQQTPVALLILDVDNFKKFNDNFGHQAGDCILQNVAEILKHILRSEDVICRYGGEEFIAILPGISFEMALERADQLRRKVSEAHPQFGGENLHGVTVSVGVAMYPLHADSAEKLVRAADRALYEAKHQGRNRIVIARQPGVEAASIPDGVADKALVGTEGGER
jgi:diguanylate cyclase (GGDEF)-like protein